MALSTQDMTPFDCSPKWTPSRILRRIIFIIARVTTHFILERQLLVQLGGRLRAARTHRGWTASHVADQAGISRTHPERGRVWCALAHDRHPPQGAGGCCVWRVAWPW
jgi:hypothetical protein